MASFAFVSRPNAVESFGGRILRFAASPINLLYAWYKARVEADTLSRFSDRRLDDIGVTRGEIDRLVFNRARTK